MTRAPSGATRIQGAKGCWPAGMRTAKVRPISHPIPAPTAVRERVEEDLDFARAPALAGCLPAA